MTMKYNVILLLLYIPTTVHSPYTWPIHTNMTSTSFSYTPLTIHKILPAHPHPDPDHSESEYDSVPLLSVLGGAGAAAGAGAGAGAGVVYLELGGTRVLCRVWRTSCSSSAPLSLPLSVECRYSPFARAVRVPRRSAAAVSACKDLALRLQETLALIVNTEGNPQCALCVCLEVVQETECESGSGSDLFPALLMVGSCALALSGVALFDIPGAATHNGCSLAFMPAIQQVAALHYTRTIKQGQGKGQGGEEADMEMEASLPAALLLCTQRSAALKQQIRAYASTFSDHIT